LGALPRPGPWASAGITAASNIRQPNSVNRLVVVMM
jgi:hypothetical protein